MIRNKEYFANLQKCYNPSVEFGDFTRSHSSDEVLGPSKIQQESKDGSESLISQIYEEHQKDTEEIKTKN